jgi:hypothetical protein
MISTLLLAMLSANVQAEGAIDAFMATDLRPADGFSGAIAQSEVRAIGHGIVRRVAGGAVTVEHLIYENLEKRRLISSYVGLGEVVVKEGAEVIRGTRLGSASKEVQVSLRARRAEEDWAPGAELDLASFLRGRGTLFVPQEEPVLLIVDQARYELRRYARGVLIETKEIGLGQGHGPKQRQGDLRTPKGMYFVIDKHRGEFTGSAAAYFGGHWIKINYPNPWDAERGLAEKLVQAPLVEKVRADWSERRATNERTALGGGIGLHGWNGEWRGEGGAHLSWGCVVMHNADIAQVYEHVPIGAMVVIL